MSFVMPLRTYERNRRITVGLGVLALVLTGITVFAVNGTMYLQTSRMEMRHKWTEHALSSRIAIRSVIVSVLDAESANRAYLLTGRPEFRHAYQQARADVVRRLKALRQMTEDNPSQQRRLDELFSLIDAKMRFLDRLVAVRIAVPWPVMTIDLSEGHRLIVKIRGTLHQMDEEEYALYVERDDAEGRAYRKLYVSLFAIIGICILILVGLGSMLWGVTHRRPGTPGR